MRLTLVIDERRLRRFVAMDDEADRDYDAPTGPPVDEEEERRRLLADAKQLGVDDQDAVELAERLAHGEPLAQAYRDVDRRLATGYTLEEAEAMLIDDVPSPQPTSENDDI
jgi:hypothetical protein